MVACVKHCSSLGRCLYEVLSLEDPKFHHFAGDVMSIQVPRQKNCQTDAETGSAVLVTHKYNERDWGRYSCVKSACFGLATWHPDSSRYMYSCRQETTYMSHLKLLYFKAMHVIQLLLLVVLFTAWHLCTYAFCKYVYYKCSPLLPQSNPA